MSDTTVYDIAGLTEARKQHGISLGVMFNTDDTMTVSVFGDIRALTEKEADALSRWLNHFAVRLAEPAP